MRKRVGRRGDPEGPDGADDADGQLEGPERGEREPHDQNVQQVLPHHVLMRG
jgi:hypothetical protein